MQAPVENKWSVALALVVKVRSPVVVNSVVAIDGVPVVQVVARKR